jgi:hypothetical protein
MTAGRKSSAGMKWEFQVLYRATAEELRTVNVAAFTEAAAKELVRGAGVEVLSATELRPLLDWEQRTFTVEEAAVYMRKSVRTIQRLQELGHLPKSTEGFPIFTRRMLDECIANAMGLKLAEVQEAA